MYAFVCVLCAHVFDFLSSFSIKKFLFRFIFAQCAHIYSLYSFAVSFVRLTSPSQPRCHCCVLNHKAKKKLLVFFLNMCVCVRACKQKNANGMFSLSCFVFHRCTFTCIHKHFIENNCTVYIFHIFNTVFECKGKRSFFSLSLSLSILSSRNWMTIGYRRRKHGRLMINGFRSDSIYYLICECFQLPKCILLTMCKTNTFSSIEFIANLDCLHLFDKWQFCIFLAVVLSEEEK